MNVLESRFFSDFLHAKAPYLDIITYKKYTYAFKHFCQALGIEPQEFQLETLNKKNIADYIQWRKTNGINNSTINADLSKLHVFAEFNEIPLIVKRLKEERRPKNIVTIEEVLKVINIFDLRQQCIWLLLFCFGLRNSECGNLKLEHIDFKNRRIYVEKGKGQKSAWVYAIYQSLVWPKLEQYVQKNQFRSGDYLFLSRKGMVSDKMIHDIVGKGKAILGRSINPHDLRHSHITAILESGADAWIAKKNARHSKISTTEIYAHESDAPTRKALEKIDFIAPKMETQIDQPMKNALVKEQKENRFLCIYCGSQMESGEIFCWNCGMQVFMLCPNPKIDCSGIIRMDKERCPKCGYEMKKAKEKIKGKYGKKVMP